MGRWITLAVLVAVFAAVLAAGVVRAQEDSTTIMYAENGEDPVATFTATDPEGATPITWSLATDAAIEGVDAADIADGDDHFMIDEDGELKFSSPPDFENPSGEGAASNTYKVVVLAADAATGGMTGFHKVTVMVTNVEEPGKVTLATSTTGGTPQYLVSATLTATASDGDITATTQTFAGDVPTEVTGVVWRWYRGGTEITGADAQDNTYTLLPDDAGENIRAVVHYVIAGNVDQEMAEKTTDYPVLAGRVGDNDLKFDPATVSRTISEGAKGRDVGAPVTATGNHGTVRYTLAGNGADNAKFDIDDKTGQITTKFDLNYEATSEASETEAGSCISAGGTTVCGVTVRATDSTGSDFATAATATATVSVDATVTITITDVDEEPTFTTGGQTVSVPENSIALWHGSTDGYSATTEAEVTYTAMDPEGRTVNYSLAGPDASKFQLSSDPPVLSFVSGPDFEAKASADGDNVYEVTVRATAGGDTGERMVRVTVGNVDEGPEVSGPSTRSFVENSEGAVATFTATDPEGVTTITWSLATDAAIDGVEAADIADGADHFMIDEDGVLKFSSPPDFDNPSGEGATSNTYKVVVLAADAATGGQTGYHKVTVTVTNLNEPGKITLSTDTAGGSPQYLVGATLTATASDGDIANTDQTFQATDRTGVVTGIVWRWYKGGGLISGAESNSYQLQTTDANSRIRVEVRYQVAGNANQESASFTTDYPVLADRVGDNELTFDPAAVSRTISEGDEGRNVGAPVTATGNHGTVRYTLAGTDADQFEIDDKTGQITTSEDLNYEADTSDTTNQCNTANMCEVTITATDSTGTAGATGTDPNFNATVTITITDVDEEPEFVTDSTGPLPAASPMTITSPENRADLYDTNTPTDAVNVTYAATDPEGRTVSYSLTGPDASKFQLSGSPPVLSFVSKPDFEAKASADGDNVYMVTVRASVGGDTGERMVRVTVVGVDEAPEISSGPAVRGMSSVDYEENGLGDVATYMVTGQEDGATVTFSLSGDDEGDFNIDSGTGVLTFASPPDYEMPADMDMNNRYMVTVMAMAGTESAEPLDVTVTVTDQDPETSVTPVAMYERDGTPGISGTELSVAIGDYINGDLGPVDLSEVIAAYING